MRRVRESRGVDQQTAPREGAGGQALLLREKLWGQFAFLSSFFPDSLGVGVGSGSFNVERGNWGDQGIIWGHGKVAELHYRYRGACWVGAPPVESSSCGGMRAFGQAARLRSVWPFGASDFPFGDNTGFAKDSR